MRPETIIYMTASVACLGFSCRAAPEDRPAARFCALALLLDCLLSNIGWYMGVRLAGRDIDAASMIALLFALFRWQRHWLLPLATLATSTMAVRGIFEMLDNGSNRFYVYKIATVNLLFVLQLLTIVAASLSGGKRGEQFDVGDNRSRRGRGLSRGSFRSDE